MPPQKELLPDECPFVVVIDSNEGAPYDFKTMRDDKGRPLIVKTIKNPMWTKGLADYSILGHENHIQVERKSLEDLFGTLGGRRDKFEEEIYRLNQRCDYAAVVVEGNLNAIRTWTGHGPHVNSVIGTMRNWQFRYPRVHWKLCSSRSAAELKTFETFSMYWDAFNRKKLPRMRGDYKERFGC